MTQGSNFGIKSVIKYQKGLFGYFSLFCLNFDLSGFGDEIQYTEYFGENNGHYSWHGDIGPNVPHRKLSIVVQLSDPEDYEGGELELSAGSYLVDGPKTKGTVIVFPSFVLHRVLPLTSGERRSLVSWVSGPRLK